MSTQPQDIIDEERATYSSLTLHRRCPQAWKYRYIDGLRRRRSEITPALDFGSWFHAARALDRIAKGLAEGTLKAVPDEIHTTDTGPSFPPNSSPADILEAAVDYWERLGETATEAWLDRLGQALPDRLEHAYVEWRERWAQDSENEAVLAVEQRWERSVPGTGVVLWGYADEVYQDRKRGIVVVRDCKTSGTLGQVTSLDEMMDSQVQLYAWGLGPTCDEWGVPRPRAVAFDRVRSKAPKTPKLTKAGKLSSSVKDYDLTTYLEWVGDDGIPYEGMKKDGSAAGVYTAEEAEIERLGSPQVVSQWFSRHLTPVSPHLVRSHLQAAADTCSDISLTRKRAAARGEASRNFGKAACQFCEFADLCRAQMVGGPGGEYAPEEYGLRYRDPDHSGR
ncbi:MAG: PD-(D/E)XK nuclease family protein [Thermobifida sp.]|nr:PD-(D/E)XK nuclease family protein [Thermobifida sp.]